MKFIDNFLDRITMYRLLLYYLLCLLLNDVVLSFFGILSFSPFSIIFSVAVLVIVSWITNKIFSKVFNAPTNVESVYISALILALIITPIESIQGIVFLGLTAVLAMASNSAWQGFQVHIPLPTRIRCSLG